MTNLLTSNRFYEFVHKSWQIRCLIELLPFTLCRTITKDNTMQKQLNNGIENALRLCVLRWPMLEFYERPLTLTRLSTDWHRQLLSNETVRGTHWNKAVSPVTNSSLSPRNPAGDTSYEGQSPVRTLWIDCNLITRSVLDSPAMAMSIGATEEPQQAGKLRHWRQ